MPQQVRKSWALTGGLGLLVVGGYLAHVFYYQVYINDDAFITFRYSLFLTLGCGPYFNVGEHVEGYTNFLLMLLMAGGIKAFGTDAALLVARAIGAAGGVLALVASWALCARWLSRTEPLAPHARSLAWAAPALVVVNSAFALNSDSGLETTLFSGWILLGLWLTQKGADEQRWCGAGVAFALAALTRPEAVIAFGAVVAGRLLTGASRAGVARRVLLIDGAIVAATVAAHLAFRLVFYDGQWLPNTYYAKAGGFNVRTGGLDYAWQFARLHLGGALVIVGILPLLAKNRGMRGATLPALLVCLAAVAGLLKTGPDWMLGYRLLVPYAPLWAALSVCGLAAVAERARQRAAPVTLAACLALLAVLSIQLWGIGREYHEYCRQRAQGYREAHVALAEWLGSVARPGQTVALMDIGIIGFLCPDLRILDITGLTDRHIAMSPGEFLRKEYDPAYILDQRPEFLVIAATEGPQAGAPGSPPALEAWTPVERRLMADPTFAQHYARPRPARPEDDELARLAAQAGAERIYRHRHPGMSYLLLVYRYHPRGAAHASWSTSQDERPLPAYPSKLLPLSGGVGAVERHARRNCSKNRSAQARFGSVTPSRRDSRLIVIDTRPSVCATTSTVPGASG